MLSADNMATFPVILHAAYYKAGFFNVRRDFDRYLPEGERPITVLLGDKKLRFPGRIDRRANGNGTARIRVGARLRDWFGTHYALGDEIKVTVLDENTLHIG